MSGASIAAEIDAAFKEVGVEVGSGEYTVTVLRDDVPIGSGPAYAPVSGEPIPHVFTALPASTKEMQKAGMTLAENERAFKLVNHGVSIAPTVADQLVADGKTWAIEAIQAKDSGGYVLSWLVKVSGPVG